MRYQLKAAFFLIVVMAGAYLMHRTGLAEKMKPEEIRATLASFGVLAPVAFIGLASLRPLLFVPAGFISVVGGMVFGSLAGTVYTLLGSSLGAVVAFGISRFFGREFVQKLTKGRLGRWSQMLEGQGAKIVFLMRLIPVFPFDAISYAAGLSHIKFKDFALGTVLGIIPGTFVYTFLGSTLHEGLTPRFIIAVTFTVVLALIPVLFETVGKYIRL
ncbi:MAG: TVP38/TMEM64 family protein [Firmicutes bacterium]|nr:TVP38/TMEM64 family protein [Bacillota bacterium]